MWTHADTCGGRAGMAWGGAGEGAHPLPLTTAQSSPSVWPLLSRPAARWPPQDGFSWLCQSCCHLFAPCWSQQSGSASNPEQLGEPLPSLVVPLSPLLCCSRGSLGSMSSCHLLSAGQSLLPLTAPPILPSSSLQCPPGLSPHGQSAEWDTSRGVHSSFCQPACPLSPALPFSRPHPTASHGVSQLTTPQSLP